VLHLTPGSIVIQSGASSTVLYFEATSGILQSRHRPRDLLHRRQRRRHLGHHPLSRAVRRPQADARRAAGALVIPGSVRHHHLRPAAPAQTVQTRMVARHLIAVLLLLAGTLSSIATHVAAQDALRASGLAVATLADLKALRTRPAVVTVAGRTTAGDGGGGVFYWSANDSGAADEALVVAPGAGAPGRYKRSHSGALEAAWFGYRPDGAADNAPALSACTRAAAALSGQCRLPPGRARIGRTVELGGAVTLAGSGPGTVMVPASDAIGTLFEITGAQASVADLTIDGTGIASATFTAVRIRSEGLTRLRRLYILGAGLGLDVPGCNACEFSELRIQDTKVGIHTGGAEGLYPGDLWWNQIVLIPTPDGTGWIVDGNSNAQYANRIETIGGAIGIEVRGAGAATGKPDGLFFTAGNFTAAAQANVRLVRGTNIWFVAGTSIGGSTAGDGLLIDGASSRDVEGVFVRGSQVRGNYKAGIQHRRGANLVIADSDVYGNSNGGGAGAYSNIEVGAEAVGLFAAVNVIAGLSSAGNLLANIQGPAKYAVELAPGALADAPDFPGRLVIEGGVQDGNVKGGVSDSSAASAANKTIRLSGRSRQAFRAYAGIAQPVTRAVWSRVRLDGVALNGGASFADGRWTPLAGVYQVNAAVALEPRAEGFLAIYKNGAVHSRTRLAAAATLSDTVEANGTDYFELYVYASSEATIGAGSDVTFFSGGP
jgi:hypothetical protein